MMPLLVSLNMIPKVALGPLIIVWFKYGIVPNMLIAFSICVFPILLTTVRGLREVEPDLLDLVKSLRGSRWQTFTKIQLPGALPYIFSGMKVAAILAVAGAIVGEFLGSDKGLGYLMLQVQVTLDTAAMFMAVLLITLIGMLLYGAVLLWNVRWWFPMRGCRDMVAVMDRIGEAGRSAPLMSPEPPLRAGSPPLLRYAERPTSPIPHRRVAFTTRRARASDVGRPPQRSKGGEGSRRLPSGDMSGGGRPMLATHPTQRTTD